MTKRYYPANERGTMNYGWLKANYSFSFGDFYDENKINFGALRVLNDDFIAGGGGFPTHSHQNMEIITIPLIGALEHKDSSGGNRIIKKNDIQIMSAGSGVQHSEFNASQSEEVNLFQLWIFPKQKNINPRYDQKTFLDTNRINQWQTIVSPTNENALYINQDAELHLLKLTQNNEIFFEKKFENAGVYFMNIYGEIYIENDLLNSRDAIGITEANKIHLKANTDSDILVIEIPLIF